MSPVDDLPHPVGYQRHDLLVRDLIRARAESRARAIRAVVAAQFTAGFACQVFCDSAREVSGAVEAERVRMDYLTVAAVQSAPVEVVDARAYPRDANGHAIVDGGAP